LGTPIDSSTGVEPAQPPDLTRLGISPVIVNTDDQNIAACDASAAKLTADQARYK
jgi:hypothetical protein